MKIHIIGCSGTGKTYLASRLAEKYKIPHFDLDNLQWDDSAGTYGVKMPVERRNALLEEILAKESWIIEGVYYAWVGQSFEDADVIYVLDVPKHVYTYRIIRRFIRRKLGFEKGKKETLKSLHNLLRWTDTFQNVNMKEIRSILQKYEDKVYYIRSSREVRDLVQGGI